MADRRIGHRVADLMRQQRAPRFKERDGIPSVMSDQFSVAVECQADVRAAEWIPQILPSEVFERARCMKRACEEIEDGGLVAGLVRPGDESLVSGHASVP